MRRNDDQIELIPDDMIPVPARRMRDNVAIAHGTKFLPIAPGAKSVPCNRCGKAIYFATHPTTKRPHPVTINVEQGIEPTRTTWGQGLSHYADCPDVLNDRAHPMAGFKRRVHDDRRR
jgi:hypothetical protein